MDIILLIIKILNNIYEEDTLAVTFNKLNFNTPWVIMWILSKGFVQR